MQSEFLKYGGNHFIKNDLKRLKRWSSLEEDVLNFFKILSGGLSETKWPPPNSFGGGLITKKQSAEETILFFKDRQGITDPRTNPAQGARIVYGLVKEQRVFIPFLVFSASEEGKYYRINSKKLLLTKSNFTKIIDEKIKSSL